MIYIIRHGQTELNNRKALQGRSDHPLNEAGVEQAKEAAARLAEARFDKVYSSPLTRALQTADIVAPGLSAQTDERLIEMDYGPYEGMSLADPAPEVVEFFSDFSHNAAPSGMEQLKDVIARTGSFVEERCRTHETILISTHAIAMKGILEYLTPGSDGSYWSNFIGNCEIYVTDYDGGCFSVPKPLPPQSSAPILPFGQSPTT